MQKKGSIIAVDDTPASLLLLTEILTDAGYNVTRAHNGKEALEYIKKNTPQLILLDVRMPIMTGFEVIKKLKNDSLLDKIPVIFLTALTEMEDRIEGLKLGAVDYITKPYKETELLLKVDTHLKIRQLQEDLLNKNILLEAEIQKTKKETQNAKFQLKKRVESESELLESEKKFKHLFHSSTNSIFVVNNNNQIIEVNDEALKIYGYSRKKMPSMSFSDLASLTSKPFTIKQIDIKSDKGYYLLNHRHIKADGTVFQVEVAIKKFKYGKTPAILIFTKDITKRQNEHKQTINEIIKAEENTRLKVARDIHEGVSPMVSAIKIFVQSLESAKDKEVIKETYNRIEKTIDDTIEFIAQISNKLSPHLLINFGLTPAIQNYVNTYNSKSEIDILFSSALNDRLSRNIEITLYRATVELINNTLVYSSANTINIDLKGTNTIEFIYSDNGIGFNFDKTINETKGGGLKNLISRIESLNGTIEFDTEGRVNIHIRIPSA